MNALNINYELDENETNNSENINSIHLNNLHLKAPAIQNTKMLKDLISIVSAKMNRSIVWDDKTGGDLN